MPIDTEQWRACIGLFCASRVLLRPPRGKQPQPKVQADTLWLNMRFALAVLLVTLRTGVFHVSRTLQLLWLITCTASWLLSSIVRLSCRRLRGVSVLLALCLVVVAMLLIMSGDVEENPGPPKIRTTSLGENDLRCVLKELQDVSHKWFKLGLELQLRVGTLERIRDQYRDPSAALLEILLHWLKMVDPPPTWDGLACALESCTVGEPRLAEQLRTKYCKTVGAAVSPVFDSAMSDSIERRAFKKCFKNLVGGISNPRLLAVSLYSEDVISSTTRAEVTSTSLPLPDRVLKLLEAVECQIECNPDAFFSFVDVLREDRPHVYLADFLMSAYRAPGKRKREQTQAQLFDIPGENWEITDKFAVALDTIKDSLAVEPPKLKGYLCCLCHPLKPDEPYVQSRLYESATTTSEIIQSLFPKLINYQNTGLLKRIVLRFGCDESKAALQEYLQHYSKFTDKRLYIMPKAVSDEELDRATGVKKLRIETSMTLEKATIADTEAVQKGLGQATGIDPDFISPAQHDPGSVILTFLVPESVGEIFCELCEEDLEILANCGITRLQIEDCVIESIHEYCTIADKEIEQSLFTDDITAKGLDIVLLLKKKVLQCTQYAHLVNLLTAVSQQDMHRVCSDDFLQRLALTFGNWIELSPYLGITGSAVQQITLQCDSLEEQSYQALLQWKQLFQDSATYESLVEFLIRHAPLSTVEAALNIISPAKLACQVLQQAYLSPERGCLWHGAPRMTEFSQRLGRSLKSDRVLDFLAFDYSSHIKDFPSAVEVVSVKSFLNTVSEKKQRYFVLSGSHGSGKTIFLKRACSLWARRLCWRKFTLVFWVDIEALAIALAPDPQYSFMKFMKYVVPEGVDFNDICDWVSIHNGEDTLLVLDGIDSFTSSTYVHAILSEPLLMKGSVISTFSLPHHAFSKQCLEYYLLGLSEDQITRQVINHYSDSPQKAEELFAFISATPAMKVLCSNPPCLAAVLSVFDSGYPNDLPTTWTQLFEQLISLFIRQCPALDQAAKDQPILQELAQWTYHGGVCSEPLRPFLSTVTPPYMISLKPAIIYSKLSLPWLTNSYLFAVHIHTLPLEEQVALMISNKHWNYVWHFFAGLCSSVETLNCVLKNWCRQDTIKCATCLLEARYIASCKRELTVEKTLMTAYETNIVQSAAQNSSISCTVAVETNFLGAGALVEIGKCLTAVSILGTGCIAELSLSGNSDGHMSLQDLQEVRALARGVAVSSTLKILTLRSTGISGEGASALAGALCVNHSLRELNLSLTGIPDTGISSLAGALGENQSLEKLVLGLSGLSTEGASALAIGLCVNHSLKEISLRDTALSCEQTSVLASALCGKHSLKLLDLMSANLSTEGASALASALCVNHYLKELILNLTGISDAGIFALSGALRMNHSLEKLDLGLTGLSAEGASALTSALCVNHSLKELNLWDTGLSPEGASALASLLCGKNSFKELNLSGDKITNAGVSALAGALTVNQSLEKIDLSSTGLSAGEVSPLASALCVNHSLRELDLSENRIPDAGVSLAGALRVNRSLENLDLSDTDISAESVSALASALCVNHSLKALDLSENRIPDAGVSLAGALRVNRSLENLDLKNTVQSVQGVFALASALRVNYSLKKLSLSLFGMHFAGVSTLAGALKVNRSLEELTIIFLRAVDTEVSELAYALEENNSLRKLHLSGVNKKMEEMLRKVAERKGIDITLF